MIGEQLASTAAKMWLQATIAGTLTMALMWPVALMQYGAQLDNTWMTCRVRAKQAGRLLADALVDRKAIGRRPVTLIGFSMGARVAFYALQELHKRGKFDVVKDAIFMGLPSSRKPPKWTAARTVVAGRLINIYFKGDWLLAFLFRYMEWGITVAGLSSVDVMGVENYDATGIVSNHGDYGKKVPQILEFIGFHTNRKNDIRSVKNK
eukprot:Trichotokara_eunicae@DN1625_c0_g1_i1.p1